jgi:hypothetical protein
VVLDRRNERSEVPHAGPELSRMDRGMEADRVWRDDVVLEMWVDVSSDAVVIRLEGVLDRETAASLTNVVRDCLLRGQSDFILDTRAAAVTPSSWTVVNSLREQIRSAGGHITWNMNFRAFGADLGAIGGLKEP